MKHIRTYPADLDQHSAVTADVRVPMRNVLTLETIRHERVAHAFQRECALYFARTETTWASAVSAEQE